MYIASAGNSNSTGIYHCTLDAADGSLQATAVTQAITNCLYITRHPAQPWLYAVGEGYIAAFRMASDGHLDFINRQTTGGDEPCYVAITGGGRYALVVNYAGPQGWGSTVVFPLNAEGGVNPASDHKHISGAGAGVHAFRQDASHPHMIAPTPDDAFILVTDLGMDQIYIYHLDRDTGRLNPHTVPAIPITSGSGPRHLAFHPTQPIMYVLSELTPVLTVIRYDAKGDFRTVATYATLPPDYTPSDGDLGADLHVTPSGDYLYLSTRGHNSLSLFSINADGTQLDYVTNTPTLGEWPRGFAIDPTGCYLIAANQHNHDLHTFRIAADTGRLIATGHSLSIPEPVCITFT